jgi:AMP phosphorylase
MIKNKLKQLGEYIMPQKKIHKQFKTKSLDLDAGKYIVIMNEKDSDELGVNKEDRVRLSYNNHKITAIIDITNSFVQVGELGVFHNIYKALELSPDSIIDVKPTEKPMSVEFIKKKMNGSELKGEEIYHIIKDIVDGNLSDIELAAYVTSIAIRGMNLRETEDLTWAMVKTGEVIKFDKSPIFDFHSVGGAPGNKITLIIVPIVAAAGLLIPKTSSRAISSACGTADIMEVIADVNISGKDIKRITETIGGTIAWGGSVNLAPADDLIIHVEYPLAIDPYSQVIASVMAKKKAMSADHLLLDIPMGSGTKVPDDILAKRYAKDFMELGNRLDIQVQCAITYGGQPIGSAVGPAMEAREAIVCMEGGKVPNSLKLKSLSLAGIILEMGGVAKPGEGKKLAKKILEEKKALSKFQEIIEAQGGKREITSDDITIGKYTANFYANQDGYVDHIDNKAVVSIARAAGSPFDKGAGILFFEKKAHKVDKGDLLFTIYAENNEKLKRAKSLCDKVVPITIEGMLLERVESLEDIEEEI